MKNQILIIEDEPQIASMVKFSLEPTFSAVIADDVNTALELISKNNYSLILLDWMLPGLSGIELVRRLGRMKPRNRTPVIMLTAKGEENDKLKAFHEGVDDYLVKPFSIEELKARIRAVLKRSNNQNQSSESSVLLSKDEKKVFLNEVELKLTKKEFLIFVYLFENQQRVCTRSEIIQSCWDKDVYDRVVDVNITRIKKKLESASEAYTIKSIRGFGYQATKKSKM